MHRNQGEAVAYLEVQSADTGEKGNVHHIKIRGNEEFYLGRSPEYCRFRWSDPTISNRHLRIHCILYEEQADSAIPPLVYATDLSTNGTYLKRPHADQAGVSASSAYGMRIDQKNGAYLLNDGDQLRISNRVTLIYHSITQPQQEELSNTQEQEAQHFSSRYEIRNRVLGSGGFGKVLVAIHRKTQRQLACKIVDLTHIYANPEAQGLRPLNAQKHSDFYSKPEKGSRIHGYPLGCPDRWPKKVKKCFREFEIAKNLSHPNIIAIKKVFWSSNTVYIFQELITGGDLFSYIEYKGGHLCDAEAAVIMRQVLKAVEYLHSQDIVHRDLKPDNILMASLNDGARIVLTDFGNARYIPQPSEVDGQIVASKRRMFSMVGTLEYAAPEVHKRNKTIPKDYGYSKSVDMWSIGSIATALLTGDVIFTDRTHADYEHNPQDVILGLSATCDLSVLDVHPVWLTVGHRPKDFIRNLLVLDESRRMSATQALAHPWFTNKCHAAEFEALYDRATKDWRPRRKTFRVVEPIIPKITSTLADDGLPRSLRNTAVSRYFAPPRRPVPALDILSALTASPTKRANTPLPIIQEELEIPDHQTLANALSLSDHGPTNTIHHLPRPSGGAVGDIFLEQLAISNFITDPTSSHPGAHSSSRSNASTPQKLLENDLPKTDTNSIAAQSCKPNLDTVANDSASILVPETPVRSIKHRLSTFHEDMAEFEVHDQTSQDGAGRFVTAKQYAQEVFKRRKFH